MAKERLFQVAREAAEQLDQKSGKKVKFKFSFFFLLHLISSLQESAIRDLERSGRSRGTEDINVTPKRGKSSNRRRSTSISPPKAYDGLLLVKRFLLTLGLYRHDAPDPTFTPEPRRRALTFERDDQTKEISKGDQGVATKDREKEETPSRRTRSPDRGRASRIGNVEEEREQKEKEKRAANRDKSVERDRSVERSRRDRDVSGMYKKIYFRFASSSFFSSTFPVERTRERPAAADAEAMKKEEEKARRKEEKKKRCGT